MIRSADVRTDAEARSREARLNRERPQRMAAADWIAAQISAGNRSSPRVVELACGAGFLAERLQRQLPGIRYCGFDLSAHLVDYARRRFESAGGRRRDGTAFEFRCANLVTDDWSTQLVGMGWAGRVDAFVSIQALHDLGKIQRQLQVLKQARRLLREGGLLAYADLLSDADNPHPSRYSGDEHEEMLRACGFSIPGLPSQQRGYEDSGARELTEVDFGDFGCFVCCK
ncbi:MAG: class I SAM-dependent methyltransferase [Caldilineaceae bacterium SB0661_bin_32]|uniref:Class I SAM-dependent methyltransferase n=1 Tax=Caldilineaceae bacterium SB0661_bin_32 TaxID=2605255 RepID=A0A6B1D9C3_9CHLR|nr:class I SAM-dependent methyltransferase [Caldilineaceae bacterium SB0661_bin_32]